VTPTSKQIVIDKSVFIAFMGREFAALCNFLTSHLLLLPDTLLYEFATATRQAPEDLLYRYERIIRAGAYYCSMSRTFVEWECKHCRPYSWFLPDLHATEQIRTGEKRPADLLVSATRGEMSRPHYKVARAFLNVSEKLKNRIDREDPCLGGKIRQLPSDRYERFRIFLESVDSSNQHHIGVDSVPYHWVKNEKQFCLSPEWMGWQRIRLTDVIVRDYCCLRQSGGGPGEDGAEHDYQDMEYVLLLSRADGIITRDKKLVKPLARAAFPGKDVFSALEEVPESYRCDWAVE